MTNVDLVKMIGNLTQSLGPVRSLLVGMGYVLGIVFVITSLLKFKKMGESKSGSSHEKPLIPIMYLVLGVMLIFLPSTATYLSNTAFGTGNVLQYIQYDPYDIYSSMGFFIKTAGVLWFIRGCVLVVHGGSPGADKHAGKGLAFIGAGILAMNFESTYAMMNYFFSQLLSATSSTGKSA